MGPFFSEIKYLGGAGQDFIELAVPEGTDISNLVIIVYNSNGTIRSETNVSDITSTTNNNGRDIYVLDNTQGTPFNGIALNNGLALFDTTNPTTPIQFVSFEDTVTNVTTTLGPGGQTIPEIGSDEIGQAGANMSLQSPDGVSYFEGSPTEGVAPCFVEGTKIATINGPIAVEDLEIGDMVRTMDAGFQPIRWIGSKTLRASDLKRSPHLKPITIAKNAFGKRGPARQLTLSPQHRVMLSNWQTTLTTGESEVLVAVKHLINDRTIQGVSPDNVTYFHLMFDQHQVIFAEGLAVESFHPGDYILSQSDEEVLAEILELFPELETDPHAYPTARLVIPSHQAQILTRSIFG